MATVSTTIYPARLGDGFCAIFDIEAVWRPAEPDVGIMVPYPEGTATLTEWACDCREAGQPLLTREMLVTLIGEAEVREIEEMTFETWADEDAYGSAGRAA